MKLATTTGDFTHYFSNDLQRVKGLYDAGFRYIDLGMYQGDSADWIYLQPGWEQKIDELKAYAEELGMQFVQAHAPGSRINPMTTDPADYDLLVKSTRRSIEICGRLGIPNIVIHTGWREDVRYCKEDEPAYFAENKKFIDALIPTMEQTGVNVLIENSCRVNMGEQYFFMTGAEMKAFLRYVNHPLLHACWDVGHALLEGHQYQDLLDLGDDLRAVHIHDNRGKRDDHMLPYMGKINLDEVLQGLRDCGYQGYFTFECDGALLSAKRRFPWENSKLTESPLFMKEAMEKLLFQTGVYILKQYDCYEE